MKTAIIISLGDLEQLMKQYVDEEMSGDEFLKEQMRFGHFLLWLRNKQKEQPNGKQEAGTLGSGAKVSRFTE